MSDTPSSSATRGSSAPRILLLVASNRGVAVLPDWVLREQRTSSEYVTRPVTKGGLTKRLYAAIREDEADKPYMAHLIRLAREIPLRMQRPVARETV